MRAFVLSGPREFAVHDVASPQASPDSVVVDVQRVGVCGTDVEFYTGNMQYLHMGHAQFPTQLGHEWMGTVAEVGTSVDPSWLGRRVTGATMVGCGKCRLCLAGNLHVCEFRSEVGIRGGFPGALAEQLAVPVTSLHALPDSVDDKLGALVERGGNALRSVRAANLSPGDRALVLGPGTSGLPAAMFARAAGADVHLMGRSARSLEYARTLGFAGVWSEAGLPDLPWDAVIDASNAVAILAGERFDCARSGAEDARGPADLTTSGFDRVLGGGSGKFRATGQCASSTPTNEGRGYTPPFTRISVRVTSP